MTPFRSVAALLLVMSAAAARPQRAPLAVVVHPDNPVSDLTLQELRRLFLGQTILFQSRARVALAEFEGERVRFYRVALGIGEDRVKRQWISQVFAGSPATPPETFAYASEVRQFVALRPGAIAFLPLAEVDASVKLVTIERRRVTDPSYPIRD